jgi:hypothetical protein
MSYKRIVLATDGSPSDETAEHIGVTLSRSVKGTLAIAHAYEHPDRVDAAVARAWDRRARGREGRGHRLRRPAR